MKKKIRIAVVGIGLMGSQHLKALNLSKRARLHSIVDLNKKSELHAKKFKVPFYRSSKYLLKNNKPDAVIVATPNQFHEKHTISFLNEKIPVFKLGPGRGINRNINKDIIKTKNINAGTILLILF